MGENAFTACWLLTAVNLDASLKEVPDKVFWGCRSLSDLGALSDKSQPGAIKKLGGWAFAECGRLSTIKLDASLEEVPFAAFRSCEMLADLGALSDKSQPGAIKKLGESAFSGCRSLTAIKLAGSLTEVPAEAFWGCNSLMDLGALSDTSQPGAIKTLGEKAFSGCSILTTVKLDARLTDVPESAFNSCRSLVDLGAMTDKNQPGTIKTLGESAFSYCMSLTAIKLDASLTEVPDFAFSHCYSLTDFGNVSGVATVGAYAFQYCQRLEETFSNGAAFTSVGENAFRECAYDFSQNPNLLGNIVGGNLAYYAAGQTPRVYFSLPSAAGTVPVNGAYTPPYSLAGKSGTGYQDLVNGKNTTYKAWLSAAAAVPIVTTTVNGQKANMVSTATAGVYALAFALNRMEYANTYDLAYTLTVGAPSVVETPASSVRAAAAPAAPAASAAPGASRAQAASAPPPVASSGNTPAAPPAVAPSGAAASAAPVAAAASQEVGVLPAPQTPTDEPGPAAGSWSLVSAILLAFMAVFGVAMLVVLIWQKKAGFGVLCFALAAGGAVVFLLVSSFAGTMVIANVWTLVLGMLALAEVLVGVLALRQTKTAQ